MFQFSTWRGDTIRVRSNLQTNLQRLTIGDQVPVLYNPDRPEDARIDTRVYRYGGPVILAAIGVGVIVVWAVMSFEIVDSHLIRRGGPSASATERPVRHSVPKPGLQRSW